MRDNWVQGLDKFLHNTEGRIEKGYYKLAYTCTCTSEGCTCTKYHAELQDTQVVMVPELLQTQASTTVTVESEQAKCPSLISIGSPKLYEISFLYMYVHVPVQFSKPSPILF